MELGPEYFMKQALRLAEQAYDEDEIPIGAVVVAQNKIIGKGYNQVERLKDPTAHAEMLAITAAANFLGAKYLPECELYITVEPCLMCFGAIQHARIPKMFIGCEEPRHGFTKSIASYKTSTIWGILGEESKGLMQSFFENKRV
ncbi:MAG: nucleoside deaminase [Bacteroidia bacterium]